MYHTHTNSANMKSSKTMTRAEKLGHIELLEGNKQKEEGLIDLLPEDVKVMVEEKLLMEEVEE